jgi:hypothetical protein
MADLYKAQPRQSHKHLRIMRFSTDLYDAYNLTLRLRNHIKVKQYTLTHKSYIGNTQKLLPGLMSLKKKKAPRAFFFTSTYQIH